MAEAESVDDEKPVLTDDEKSALLDGVASGAVEVQSGEGPKYAEVRDFDFAPHLRIRSNSYPRLQILNEQLAERVAEYCSSVLYCHPMVEAKRVSMRSFADHRSRFSEFSTVTVFDAPPLDLQGLIILKASAISHLVEAFFGGDGNDVVPNASGAFTSGEMVVCRLFSKALLSMLQEVWHPIVDIKPELKSTAVGTDLVEDISDSDLVLASRFEMTFGPSVGVFLILLPMDMVRSLVPLFEGKKRNRDASEDIRWATAIKGRLPDASITVTVSVGDAQLPLSRIASLRPGDVIDIDNPRDAIVTAGNVPILRGRFGIHAGHNAVETTEWIDSKEIQD